ncbi:MAG TPA: M20/M25/M40 family metallo-hydrolase, partial [Chitinophagales bacterium]
FDENDRKRMHQMIRHTLDQITQEHQASYDLNILQGFPVVMNDEELTERCKDLAETLSVVTKVYDLPIRMGAEDFGYYTQLIPASFYRVGVGNKAQGITSPIHSPTFNIDESALKVSMSLMSLFAAAYLND